MVSKGIFFQFIIVIISCSFLQACGSTNTYAPVTEVSPIEPIPHSGTHRVMAGETLYSIAWRYGKDYRVVAKNNDIEPPYTVYTGQEISVRGKLVKKKPAISRPKSASAKTSTPAIYKDSILKKSREPHYRTTSWAWPVKGRVVRPYSNINKGIDIGGRQGQSVFAAAPGKVVYSGNGLKSYGNLIIIKHNNLYLSAYAYNKTILVREGEWVKQGQKIAKMGTNRRGRTVLHFEIRRAGKPLNPLKLLRK